MADRPAKGRSRRSVPDAHAVPGNSTGIGESRPAGAEHLLLTRATINNPKEVIMKRSGALFAGLSIAMCLCSSATWAAVDPAVLKARQKFFGIDNVDTNTGAVKKDKVIASWATNTTYVTSIL